MSHGVGTRRPMRRSIWGDLLPTPRPRLLASNADGFHSVSNDNGPQLLDSTIEFTGDDLGNICSMMAVFLGVIGDGSTMANVNSLAFMDASGSRLQRAAAGTHIAFYHLHTLAFQGRAVLSAAGALTNNSKAVAAMRAGYDIMQAAPFLAQLVQTTPWAAPNMPVALEVEGGLPSGVQPYWSLAVLEESCNGGAVVEGCTLSDSYARAFMVKGRNSVFRGNTFRRAGGVHIGPEENWLEGDPGISNVTVEDCVLDDIGTPAITVDAGIPSDRDITLRNNTVLTH